MKNKKIILTLCEKINKKLKEVATLYPSSSYKDSNTKEGYLFFKELNKNNFASMFAILNTKKDKNNHTVYILENNSKTIFFDYTTRNTLPWFTVKQKEVNFSYKPGNSIDLYENYTGKEEQIENLLKSTIAELDETRKFFKNFKKLTSLNDNEANDYIWTLMKDYFTDETMLSLSLIVNKEISKELISSYILKTNKKLEYTKEINLLFEKKLINLLIKFEKQKSKETVRRESLNFYIYQYSTDSKLETIREKYIKKIVEKEILLKPIIDKFNLYIELDKNIINTNNITRKKI